MNPKNDQSGQSRTAVSPAPRKRFRIDKLEERIAPKKPLWAGPSKNCCGRRGCDG